MNEKDFLKKLKRPTGWLLAGIYTITLLSAVGSLLTLALPTDKAWVAALSYALYALAALSLGYTVYTIVIYAKKIKPKINAFTESIPFLQRLRKDFGYRTIMFAFLSLGLSLSYSLYNGGIALFFHSIWYGALATYYIVLVSIRGSIMLYHNKTRDKRRNERTEIRKYRNCGILLIVTILALSVAIAQMVADNAFFERAGLLIYVAAAYTFLKLGTSFANFFKAQKQTGYTIRALRNANLADALVSVLALQTSMFHAFAEPSMATGLANALTGGAVCLLIILLGIYMIITGNKALKTTGEKE